MYSFKLKKMTIYLKFQRFDKENDGGYRPSFQINEVDGQKRIVVETDNEYAKLETVFEFVDKKITQISSQEKK